MGVGRVGLDGGMVTDTPQRSLWKQNGLLLRASFTAPDATALGGYQPEVGPVGSALVGAWSITGNKLLCTTAANSNIASWALGVADVALACTLRVSGANLLCGLAFRITDANNYWLAFCNSATNQVFLYEVVANVFTARVTAASTFVAGTTYRLVVQAQGALVVVYLDGVSLGSYGSAATGLAVKNHGLFANNSVTQTFDDLAIWRAGAVGVPGGVI